MAIWDQGVNQFGKDIKQVSNDGSSGSEAGFIYNYDGTRENNHNITGENGWQVNGSGQNIYNIDASSNIDNDDKLINCIKVQISNIMSNLENAQTYFDRIYVSNNCSFVCNETRKCINCCYNILNNNDNLYEQSKYTLISGGGSGPVMIYNDKFLSGYTFIVKVKVLLDDCKNFASDIKNGQKKQKMTNELYILSSLIYELDTKLDKHRDYLVANKNYSGYINDLLNKINDNLGSCTSEEEALDLFSKYYVAIDEHIAIDENSYKNMLLFKERIKSIEYEEKLELLKIKMTEIQEKLFTCNPTSSEYSELLKQHDNLMKQYYQTQIDYYDQRVNVDYYKDVDYYTLNADEQKLVDIYVEYVIYNHTAMIQQKSAEYAKKYGYDTYEYYDAMRKYYWELGQDSNRMYGTKDKSREKLPIDGYGTLDWSNTNGGKLSDFIWHEFDKQFDIESDYYDFMFRVKVLEKGNMSIDDYVDTNYYMYYYLVQMLDRIKDTKPLEEQDAFYELYREVKEVTLRDWYTLWFYQCNPEKLNTVNEYIKYINLKDKFNIATKDEKNLVKKDANYIWANMAAVSTLSFIEGGLSLLEGVPDIALAVTGLLVKGVTAGNYGSGFINAAAFNYCAKLYEMSVSGLGIDEAIANSIVHDNAYNFGYNLASLVVCVCATKCPVVFSAMTAGASMQQLFDAKVDPDKAAMAGLVMYAMTLVSTDWRKQNIELAEVTNDVAKINKLALESFGVEALSQIVSISAQYVAKNPDGSYNDVLQYLRDNSLSIVLNASAAAVSVGVATQAYKSMLKYDNIDDLPDAYKRFLAKKADKNYFAYSKQANKEMLAEFIGGLDASDLSSAVDLVDMGTYNNWLLKKAHQDVVATFIDHFSTTMALHTTFADIDVKDVDTYTQQALNNIVDLANSAITYDKYEITAIDNRKDYSHISNGYLLPTADSYLSDKFVCAYVKSLFPQNHIIQKISNLNDIANFLCAGYSMDFVTFQNASSISNNVATTGSFGTGNVQTGGMKAVPKWYLEEYAKENPNVCYFDSNGVFIIKDYMAFSNKFMDGEYLDPSVGVYMVETRVPINGNNIGIPSAYNLNNESLNYLDYLSVNETTGKIDEILPIVSVTPFDVDPNLINHKVYEDDNTGIQYCVSHVVGGK